MLKKLLTSLFIVQFLTITPAIAANKVNKSQLELRAEQTRYFETANSRAVMKAAINTLQDNGFIIQNIESDLGYITARKEFRAKRVEKGRVALYSLEYLYYGTLTAFSFGACAPYLIYPSMHMHNELSMRPIIVDSNITFEQVGNRTKVRFTFVEKILENGDGFSYIKASPRRVVRYYNSKIYQEFFNQLEKNLFLENNQV